MGDLRKTLQESGDKLSDLEEQFREDIDKILKHIDKKDILKSPDKMFAAIIESIIKIYSKKYKKNVIDNTLKATKDIIKNVQSKT